MLLECTLHVGDFTHYNNSNPWTNTCSMKHIHLTFAEYVDKEVNDRMRRLRGSTRGGGA